MNRHGDTRAMRILQKPVFVDWRGRRRRLVVAAGVMLAVALAGWLALILVSVGSVLASATAVVP